MININNIIGEGLRLLDADDGISLKSLNCLEHFRGFLTRQELEEKIRQEELNIAIFNRKPKKSVTPTIKLTDGAFNTTMICTGTPTSICSPPTSVYIKINKEMEESGFSIQLSDDSIISVKELMTIVTKWRKLEKEKKWAEISKKHGL